jgi:hypothetical protein
MVPSELRKGPLSSQDFAPLCLWWRQRLPRGAVDVVGSEMKKNDWDFSTSWLDVLTSIVGSVCLFYLVASSYYAEMWTGETDENAEKHSETPDDDPGE